MARIRSIKPEFWASEKVGRLSVGARLTFIGMISLADDEGRGRTGGQVAPAGGSPLVSHSQKKGSGVRVGPRFLISTLYPYDSHNTTRHIPSYLKEIEEQGLVVLYDGPDGCSYYWLPGFSDNQYIEKKTPSKLPPPPTESQISPPHPLPIPDDMPLEGKGREGKGEDRGVGSEPSKTPAPELPVPPELGALELYRSDQKLIKQLPQLLAAWRTAYPGVNVEAEIRKAHAWEIANPKNRKINRPRFLGNWLNRAQDQGPRNNGRFAVNPQSEAAKHQGNSKPCGRCGGRRMIEVDVPHPRSGEMVKAVSNCTACGGSGRIAQ